ncbi:helix-turn-helix domain-containing protein [Glutamicibacter arilaitensis]|uniref:helix-turn-helix domain-containing protein n=1 Tax=Glutamicibacter arilaitensis TaxID=256701 RepID=UPI003F9A5E09
MSDRTGAMNSAQNELNFIRNMKRIREAQGLSQGQFAARMTKEFGWDGFHQTTISRIEKGERPVRLGEAAGIAEALGVEVWKMLLPDDASKQLANLESSIHTARQLGLKLGQNVGDYMFYQSAISDNLNSLQELTWGSEGYGFDKDYMAKLDDLKRKAKVILETSYVDQISDFFEHGYADRDDLET